MEYRQLGSTDLSVSVLGLGCNSFGGRLDATSSASVVAAALDAGVTFFDTAPSYAKGESEVVLGRALAGHRDDVVIATKVALPPDPDVDLAAAIRASVEASLGALRTDRIDLFQLHFPVKQEGAAVTVLTALARLVEDGKVRAIGSCNHAGWRLAAWQETARHGSMPGFASAQNYYNLVARQAEAELVPSCVEYGVSLIPYYPLGGGFLTGRDTRTELEPKKIAQLLETPDNVTVAANLRAFAEHRGHALFELAISWLCRRTRVASVIAGATSPEQVLANAQACDWQLHPDELAAIDLLTETSVITDPETPPIFAAPSTT